MTETGRNSDTNFLNFITKSDEQIQEFINTKDPGEANLIKSDTEEAQDDSKGSRRSLTERLFSKMEAGSLRGSIFAMSSLALGTGCLALPLQFKNMSLLFALFVLILSGMAAYWSLSIMIQSSIKYRSHDYSKLVFHVFGKCFSLVLDTTILIYIFGILISYQVIIYDFLGSFIYSCFIDSKEYSTFDKPGGWKEQVWSQREFSYPISFGIAIFILIPLCLLKDISKMRFASLAGICIILYNILVVAIEFPFFLHDYLTTTEEHKQTSINWIDIETGFTSQLLFFKGAGTIFFAYTCHVGAFPVYKTLKNNGLRRIQKVFRRSIILDTILYILIGVCGYLSVPYDVPPLIINRATIFKNDSFMIIGRLGIAITLMLTLPANYNAFRLSFLEQVYGSTEITDKKNYLVTIPTILLATFIAILYDKINDYISILGGFCSVIIAFIFPVILYVKTNEYSIKHWKNISSIIIVTILALVGFSSGVVTIIGIISPQ